VPEMLWLEEAPDALDHPFFVAEELRGYQAAPQMLFSGAYDAVLPTVATRKWTILGEIARADPAALGLPEPAQAASREEALAIIANEPLGGALVDINLGDEKGWPVADALAERGIPFAFTSGGGDILPPAHAHRRLVAKPFRISDIEAALAEFAT